MQFYIDEDYFYLNDQLISFLVDEVRLQYEKNNMSIHFSFQDY